MQQPVSRFNSANRCLAGMIRARWQRRQAGEKPVRAAAVAAAR